MLGDGSTYDFPEDAVVGGALTFAAVKLSDEATYKVTFILTLDICLFSDNLFISTKTDIFPIPSLI